MPAPRDRTMRPAPWDTFGGGDLEVHAAMHEALLAALTPGEDLAVRVEGARQALRAGVPRERLEALYGVRPEGLPTHRDELPDSEHEALLAGADPEVVRGLRARTAAMAVEAGLISAEDADAAFDLRGHPLPELEVAERLRPERPPGRPAAGPQSSILK